MYGGSYLPKGNRMQLIKVDRERRAAWPIPISARHMPGALVCFRPSLLACLLRCGWLLCADGSDTELARLAAMARGPDSGPSDAVQQKISLDY